jgi:hypothetical protein
MQNKIISHPGSEYETHVDTRVLWQRCQHAEAVEVAAILDPVSVGDRVAWATCLI